MNTKNCQILKNSSFFQMHDDFFGYIRGISSVGMVFFLLKGMLMFFKLRSLTNKTW